MKATKLILAVVLGMATTFGLFALMNSLVNNPMQAPEEQKTLKIPDLKMPNTKIENRFEEAKPEKPDEPEAPPPELPEPEFVAPDANMGGINMEVPVVEADVGVGGMGGLNMGEGDMIPIVKAAYEYPTSAASRGIEGSCEVVFTVTETGSVIDAVADEAKCITTAGKPTSVFNRSSVKAALKFKYKPRVVDGKPVAVTGVRNKFVYQLAKDEK